MPKLAVTLLAAATAAAGAMAASSSTLTTSWMNLGFDNTPVASVIAADATAATYLIACSPSTTTNTASTTDDDDDLDSSSDCGIPGNAMTLIAGPSTMRYYYAASSGATADVTMDEYCDITASTERAVCTAVIGGKDADFPGTQTATFSGTDVSWSPLYVTAGQEKLAAAATKAGASASATAEATGSRSSSSSSGAAAGTSEGCEFCCFFFPLSFFFPLLNAG